jgi:hypothetical protein
MKYLLLILVVVLVVSIAHAKDCTFNVQLTNPTDDKVEYLLYWQDHPFKYFKPVNMAGGELDPGESHYIENSYICGDYYVDWFQGDNTCRHTFKQTETETITLEPNFECVECT